MRTMSTTDDIDKVRAENQRLRKENADPMAVLEDLLRFQGGESNVFEWSHETWQEILERARQLAKQAIED